MPPIKCFFVEDTGRQTKWRKLPGGGRGRDRILRRTDTGELVTRINDLPPGAMWFAPWLDDSYCKPQLDHVLVVKTPGGDWVVDSQSSNCTMPGDGQQLEHHCWIIHGTVPNITVDKSGVTCQAGGGSIQCGSYHGFLRDGFLVE